MEYFALLYKHQWNTKWAFPQKLHIFTREDISRFVFITLDESNC